MGSSGAGGASHEDHVNPESHQLVYELREPIVSPLGIAALKDEVLSLDIADSAQSLSECHEEL